MKPAVTVAATAHGATSSIAPVVAVSTRKLISSYSGPCIKVRNTSNNALQDIWATGNNLDETSLNSFLSGAPGAVQTLYDQSGQGNHYWQDDYSLQPILEKDSTLYGLRFGNSRLLVNSGSYSIFSLPAPFNFVYAIGLRFGSDGAQVFLRRGPEQPYSDGHGYYAGRSGFVGMQGSSNKVSTNFASDLSLGQKHVVSWAGLNDTVTAYSDGSQGNVTASWGYNSDTNPLTLGTYAFNHDANFTGLLYEFIFTANNTDRGTLEQLINNYIAAY